MGPRLCAETRGESRAQVLEACDWYLSFPKIPSGADSRCEAESAPHPARCSDCEPWASVTNPSPQARRGRTLALHSTPHALRELRVALDDCARSCRFYS